MHTQHSTLTLARHTLHRIDFQPDTFNDGDLLWLPHHAELAHAGRKRRSEHLAGRIATAHALKDWGEKSVPGIGERRQPLWPDGLCGSISHCGSSALAVVDGQPVGVDIENIFSPQLAAEVATQIASPSEIFRLQTCGLPFCLALTLAFSAKESLYKAWSTHTVSQPGFPGAELITLDDGGIDLRLTSQFSPTLAGQHVRLDYQVLDEQVITCTVKNTTH